MLFSIPSLSVDWSDGYKITSEQYPIKGSVIDEFLEKIDKDVVPFKGVPLGTAESATPFT